MSISTPFIRRPIATSLLMAALVLVGIAAYPFLPVAPLPRVDFPTITVNARLPGASPETMATTVAQPLERQFAAISGIAQMTSISVQGQSQITLQFDLDRNIDAAAGDVQAAINAASGQLPKNLPSAPTYWKVNPSESPILILSVQSDAVPLIEVDDYADTVLSQQISQVSGVSQVLIGGEQKRAVRVQVDPAKLAAMGMTLEDVRDVLVERHGQRAEGHDRRRPARLHDLRQRPAHQGGRVQQRHPGLPERRAGAGARHRPGDRRAGEPQLAGWQNGKRGIILMVFKQPGANVIDTVERIKAALPRLEAAIPPSIHAGIIMDRTQTIRASVTDVQFTLLLSVSLVVMVIFLFLRSVWATMIPSITVPVALIGTFAVMYLLGLQPRQPVADGADHRGRLRGGRRHRDAGEHLPPHRGRHEADGGGAEGRRRDRLHHRLDQPVADRGVHPAAADGRHRRPAVPRVRHDRDHRGGGLGLRVADADADDVLALPAARQRRARPAVPRQSRRCSPACWRSTAARWTWRCGIPFITLLVFLATVSLTVFLLHLYPEGLLPDAGYRRGDRRDRGRAGRLLQQMSRIQQQIGDVVAADPDVLAYGSTIGAGIGGQTANNGRMYIALKPWAQRVGGSAQDFIARLRPKLQKLEGGAFFMQAAQDIRVGGRLSKTEFQYTLQDADLGELYQWAPKILARLKSLPMLRDVTTDQQAGGTTATLTIDRDAAARFGVQPQVIDDTLYDAFGQRQITQYFSQVNSYHVILEVMPGQASDVATLDKLYVKSRYRPGGAAVHLRAMDDAAGAAAVDQPPEPVPRGDHLLQPGARRGAGPGGDRDPGRGAADGRADHGERHVPGHRPGVPELAGVAALSDRGGADHRVHHPRHPVRELHPAADHPVHAAVGRRRRAADAADRATTTCR